MSQSVHIPLRCPFLQKLSTVFVSDQFRLLTRCLLANFDFARNILITRIAGTVRSSLKTPSNWTCRDGNGLASSTWWLNCRRSNNGRIPIRTIRIIRSLNRRPWNRRWTGAKKRNWNISKWTAGQNTKGFTIDTSTRKSYDLVKTVRLGSRQLYNFGIKWFYNYYYLRLFT